MKKGQVSIVIAGHKDHGKSTLIGRLLFETNSLPKEKIAELKEISRQLGKDTDFAYITDQLREERENSLTIDTTQFFFKTRRNNYCVIDTPGHIEFLKNMLTGASHAEAAVLIVDASEGIKEQTLRHGSLISFLGINNVIIAVNKIDLIEYNEGKFNEIKNSLLGFFERLKLAPLSVIPISAKSGDNILKKSRRLNWHKGPSLASALDSLKVYADESPKPMRLPVQDAYKINGEEIAVGEVASGVIRQGQKAILLPSMREAIVTGIRVFGKRGKIKAVSGENIGITLSGPSGVKRGEIIAEKRLPPKPVNSFKGNIFWLSSQPLKLNEEITLRCATQEAPCYIEAIERKFDSSSLSPIEDGQKQINANEYATAVIKALRPLVVESFSEIKGLGRFIFERGNNLEGLGIAA